MILICKLILTPHINQMKKLFSSLSILMVLLFIGSCAQIYTDPSAKNLVNNHRNIAIIPPDISISASRNTDAEAIREHQRTESLMVQKDMQSWMLRRKAQGRIRAEIQDVATTNSLLQKAGYPEKIISPETMCEILNVNAVVRSTYSYAKPMSEAAAIAVSVLSGGNIGGNTNEVRASINIYDCSAQKMIWSFSDRNSGGMESSTSTLLDGLIKSATRRMPYNK